MVRFSSLALVLALVSCAHAPPELVQVFHQVNWVYDPDSPGWDQRLSLFVQASSADGNGVFDRLHLVHDDGLYLTLTSSTWTVVDRPGEHWVGTNGIRFPEGRVPTGPWRVILVTKAGQRVDQTFAVAPRAPGQPPPSWGPVALRDDPAARTYRVSGWVRDYLVWARDAQGRVLSPKQDPGRSVQRASGNPDGGALHLRFVPGSGTIGRALFSEGHPRICR